MQSVAVASLLGVSVVLQCLLVATLASDSESSPSKTDADVDIEAPQGTELDILANYLSHALSEDEWTEDGGPLVYVEGPEDNHMPLKRSRYYRRYPWKRQNSRDRAYVEDNRYMCNPTREDVFQLLVALHEAREGNYGRTVNFCNRKRPASAIFTNIRFLGKRRK